MNAEQLGEFFVREINFNCVRRRVIRAAFAHLFFGDLKQKRSDARRNVFESRVSQSLFDFEQPSAERFDDAVGDARVAD